MGILAQLFRRTQKPQDIPPKSVTDPVYERLRTITEQELVSLRKDEAMRLLSGGKVFRGLRDTIAARLLLPKWRDQVMREWGFVTKEEEFERAKGEMEKQGPVAHREHEAFVQEYARRNAEHIAYLRGQIKRLRRDLALAESSGIAEPLLVAETAALRRHIAAMDAAIATLAQKQANADRRYREAIDTAVRGAFQGRATRKNKMLTFIDTLRDYGGNITDLRTYIRQYYGKEAEQLRAILTHLHERFTREELPELPDEPPPLF